MKTNVRDYYAYGLHFHFCQLHGKDQAFIKGEGTEGGMINGTVLVQLLEEYAQELVAREKRRRQ